MNTETITRRGLLRTTALVPVAIAAASCAQIEAWVAANPNILQQLSAYASAAASAALAILPDVEKITAIPQGVATAVTDLQTLAGDIATATVSTAAGFVGQLEGAINIVVGGLSKINIGSTGNTVVAALDAALPIIETLLAQLLGKPAPAAMPRTAMGVALTPERVLDILQHPHG